MPSDEDPIENSQSFLPDAGLRLDFAAPRLAPINATIPSELKHQPRIPNWSLPTFRRLKLDSLQNFQQTSSIRKKDVSDGFVGPELLVPNKFRKRKRSRPNRPNLNGMAFRDHHTGLVTQLQCSVGI
jgi:hypothetical protein